jgi:hypothetical protein
MRGRLIALALLAVAATWAPVARAQGPPLDVDPALLSAALSCPGGLGHPDRPVVLLVHGTGTTGQETWPEGLGRSLAVSGFDWCMVELPDRALGDIQTSSEYVVAAVRELGAATGRRIDLIGHSQGAVEIRWAVRFWPDVRAQVDDLVTLAGANDGVQSASFACSGGQCAPAIWQMRVGAALEAALNKVPAPPGPSYTAIYSSTDELVQPASSATIPGASNVLLQELCPGRYVEHAYIVFDAPAVATTLDALSHPGAADPARVPREACSQMSGPGIDPAASFAASATLGANALTAITTHPAVATEPPLRGYASGARPGSGGSGSAPRGSVRVVGARRWRNGSVRLRARVSGSGTLTVSHARQRQTKARFRRVVRRVSRTRTVVLGLRPTAAGRALLARRGAFRARARLSFEPSAGAPVRRTRTVRFTLQQ